MAESHRQSCKVLRDTLTQTKASLILLDVNTVLIYTLCYCVQNRSSVAVCAVLISVRTVFPGRKFVSILMRFWYLTSARLPDDDLEGTRLFQVAIGGEEEAETKRLLTANYE